MPARKDFYKNMQFKVFHDTCMALGPVGKGRDGRVEWLFECFEDGPECEGEFVAKLSHVRTGDRKSCGCLEYSSKGKIKKDITGQVFHGTCKALKFIRMDGKHSIWLFKCLVGGPGCKGTFECSAARVRVGDRKSCGCHVREDVTNKIFYDSAGNPTCQALKYVRSGSNGNAKWLFKCLVDGPGCKGYFEALIKNIKSGRMKSCGCYHKINASKIHTTHGMSSTPEYKVWYAMNSRCYNPNNPAYPNYGGRGIKVCWRWNWNNPDSLKNFLADKGPRLNPDDTLERYDNDGDYDDDNTGWEDMTIQQRNKRNVVIQGIEEAEFIRDLYFDRKVSTRNIAEFFRCSENNIKTIIGYGTWV